MISDMRDVTNAMSSFPYVQQRSSFGASFPLTGSSADPPPFTTSPPVPSISVVDPNHELPRTYEWNVAVEQSFGGNDVLGLTYVGAAGRKLMRRDIYYAPNPDFTYRFDVQRNAGSSSLQRAASTISSPALGWVADTSLLHLESLSGRRFFRRRYSENVPLA